MENMDLTQLLLLSAVFLFVVAVIAVLFLFWTESRFAEKRTVKKRLLYMSAGGKHGQEKLSIYRESALKDVGALERLAFKFPRLSALDRMLLKTDLPLNASTFIFLTVVLAAVGFLIGLAIMPQKALSILPAAILALLPYGYLKLASIQYYRTFEEQLPEALDLLARAMRSGHALTSGMEMISSEMEDPIKSEFGAVVDEVNLGLTLKEAFDNLCERVPSTDLRFFAIAVLVQKETGGNIAEILDNISRLIRERTQFARQVRAMTAEGRYSAGVLIALPILMFTYIYFVNNKYISMLWLDPMGQIMLGIAIVLQIVGAFFISRIVSIEI